MGCGNISLSPTDEREIPPTLRIYSPIGDLITNNSNLFISGYTDSEAKISIEVRTDNLLEVLSPHLDDSGYFKSLFTLKEGSTLVEIIAYNSYEIESHEIIEVIFDRTPPLLEVSEPNLDGFRTENPILIVKGKTDGITVTVNGESVETFDNKTGVFEHYTILQYGENTIEIASVDQAGNRSLEVKTVFLEDSNPNIITGPGFHKFRFSSGSETSIKIPGFARAVFIPISGETDKQYSAHFSLDDFSRESKPLESVNLNQGLDQIDTPYLPDFYLKYDRKSPERLKRNINLAVNASAVEPPQIGDIQEFWAYNIKKGEFYKTSGTLKHISEHAYLFVEKDLLDKGIDLDTTVVGTEFDNIIYPNITEIFGGEAKPGIDADPHVVILILNIKGAGGFFSEGNSFSKEENPYSNEREMIYVDYRGFQKDSGSDLRSYSLGIIAHEFQHLVSYNQKFIQHGLHEDLWLNEGLSSYAQRILGYKGPEVFAFNFFKFPNSLTRWDKNGYLSDYGAALLFITYLADWYGGGEIISNIMESSQVGGKSITHALQKSGFEKTFEDIFLDWVISNFYFIQFKGKYDEKLKYGYMSLDYDNVFPKLYTDTLSHFPQEIRGELLPYSAHYFELQSSNEVQELTVTVNSGSNEFSGIIYLPEKSNQPGSN